MGCSVGVAMSRRTTPVMWRLGRSLPTRRAAPTSAVEDSLAARERAVGLQPDQPFLLRPDGSADMDVLAFFTSSRFKLLSEQTQESYAKDLRMFLSFLESQERSWAQCTTEDIADYEHWRRRDRSNPNSVSGAKFSREHAACKTFFDWQHRRGTIPATPFDGSRRSGEARFSGGSLRPRDARPNRVKWLTPRAYRQWRDTGLGGRLPDGGHDPSWRDRNDGRNLAFANLLWTSGLRLREAGSLLVLELPDVDRQAQYLRSRVADAVAKGRGRDFWMAATTRHEVDGYIVSTRAAAIGKARSKGRYENVPNRLVIVGRDRANLRVRDTQDRVSTVNLNRLGWRDRLTLFIETEAGLEPAMLFLAGSGMPISYETWETIFTTANVRCAQLGVRVSCYPHMLRHSFALRMLLTLMHAFDQRMGLTPEERKDYRLLFGDPWTLVQTLLGHTNPQTTRDIYLEPVSGLQVDIFLNPGESDDENRFTEVVARQLAATGLVNDGSRST